MDLVVEPAELHSHTSDAQVWVARGTRLLYQFDADDDGMRNLAIVSLTDAGKRAKDVAQIFGISATYVSILRSRARRQGSAGLVTRRGRPPKLSQQQVTQARAWAREGWTQQAIAERLSVAQSVISQLLATHPPVPAQEELALEDSGPSHDHPGHDHPGRDHHRDDERGDEHHDEAEPADEAGLAAVAGPEAPAVSRRVSAGVYWSRYAGAMLAHPYLEAVGASEIFATVTGAPARNYDDQAILTTAALGFGVGRFDGGGH